MKILTKFAALFIVIAGLVLSSGTISWAQLTLEWCQKTPEGEDHTFREIVVNTSSQKLYITDTSADRVLIYKNSAEGILLDTFGGDVWQGAPVGPYGMDTADDKQIYISLWEDRDFNEDGAPDYSLWRCTPSGKNLICVCSLPEPPRGIQAFESGSNTVVYVSSTYGKIIRCTAETPFRFTSEVLFESGIWMNQQDVLLDKFRNRLYVSSWTIEWGVTPYSSPVTKWTLDGVRDESFSVSYLTSGDVPSLAFDSSENFLYLLHNSFAEGVSRVYKVDAMTGEEIDHVDVGQGGINGGGGIVVDRKGDIYFSIALSRRYVGPSIWGKVVDLNISKKIVENNTNLAEPGIVTDYKLFQNSPNPFNASTQVRFALPQETQVSIIIYDALGRKIATLVDGKLNSGEHSVVFSSNDLSSGIYFCQLQTGSFIDQKKMVLIQ